jgi:hypothetical protein
MQVGFYTATATITDTAGGTTVATTTVGAIPVPDFPGKWTSFKGALAQGDVEGALRLVAEPVRDSYRAVFQALGSDLPTIAATLTDLRLLSAQGELAETVTVRLEDGEPHVYFIYFVPDADGIWRVRGM